MAASAQVKKGTLSFEKDIAPVISRNCMPCHAEDNFNPSELSLDSYNQLMAGGKNGVPVIPGKAEESILVKKLSKDPPFGDRMPLNSKRKVQEGKARWLTDEEIKLIVTWVDQGAKKN
jgi:uncharacterized membrane protein